MLILIENGDVYAPDYKGREVMANGKRLVVDGSCKARPKFLEESSRNVELVGDENEEEIHLART